MRSWRIELLATLLAALIFRGAPPAVAGQGTVNAVSYKQIPAGQSMAVRPWDNSDENLELAREFTKILVQRGFAVADDAPLVISFTTRDVLGYWSAGQRRHILEVEGHGGRTGGENARVRLNLYSSQGGVLNKGKEPGNVVPSKYMLEVTIDKRRGERLWQGEATAALKHNDGFTLLRAMLPALLNHMDQTVRRESVKF
jgi:hypothetical protein